MATGTLVRHSSSAAAPQGAIVGRDIAHWITSRMQDAGPEAEFTLEADERFWRLRRALGETSSMVEARLPVPATVGDLGQAVARWAPTVGLSARVQHEGGLLRMTLSRPQD
ncbi:MAG: hypothetical protein R3A48_09690 [Polyangiales bacterium]